MDWKKIEEMRSILETIPNEFEGREFTVELRMNELTSICPFTGYPDFYSLSIIYIPNKELVELKRLKLYLLGFRDVEITSEALLNIVFKHLSDLMEPKYIKVELHVNIRGGIEALIRRERGETS